MVTKEEGREEIKVGKKEGGRERRKEGGKEGHKEKKEMGYVHPVEIF